MRWHSTRCGQKFLHSVQCHICQNWRYDAALWSAFIRGEQFVLENESSLEKLLEHRFIHRDMLCQPVVADMVKAPFNVALQNPLRCAFLAQRSKDIFTGILRTTSLTGTPQGGVISPILANMTLDGMQELLASCFHKNSQGKINVQKKNANKVNLVRYADDFIVTAATKEIAEEAKELIRGFLAARGLELSEEKTVITHIDDGFDMLGWTFRKFNEKLIIKPSKKATKAFIASLSETVLGRGKSWKQEVLIEKLNQQIRGWANYHQSVCAQETFSLIDHRLFQLLWKWAKRRHPEKGRKWVKDRYWHTKGTRHWVFSSENSELIALSYIPIIRHTKVRMNAYEGYHT